MKNRHFAAFAGSLGLASFALTLVLSGWLEGTRGTIHAMIGGLPLPSLTSFSLASAPCFYLFVVWFLGLMAAGIRRPSLLTSLRRACIVGFVAELVLLCVVLGGVAIFFSELDHTMSPS